MSSALYTSDFYRHVQQGALDSATVVVPLILSIISPKSVIDVGCGTGCWLRVFQQHGIQDVRGIDGQDVPQELLLFDPRRFLATDLSIPFNLSRRADLLLSLEVAEHLPSESAEGFVDSLVRLSHVVLFSAAIPGQGGTNHLNEQWPSYWAALFAKHDYAAIDCLRPKIWNDNAIKFWYRQNTILYAYREYLRSDSCQPELRSQPCVISPLPLVHPELFRRKCASSGSDSSAPHP